MDELSISEAKARIRREALKQRDALASTTAIENALALVDRLDALGDPTGLTVAGYWPIRSEIDPRPLLSTLRERGARIALPVVSDEGMVFRDLTRETELVPAGFGTFGPPERAASVTPNWILLPLSAFDRTGGRLGYGQGHYDRAIAKLRAEGHDPRLVGVAHALQERDALPVEPHDVRLHAVLCESGMRAISSS